MTDKVATRCEACQSTFDVPLEYVGKRAKCPKCDQRFIVMPVVERSSERSSFLQGKLAALRTWWGVARRRPKFWLVVAAVTLACFSATFAFASPWRAVIEGFWIALIPWCFIIPLAVATAINFDDINRYHVLSFVTFVAGTLNSEYDKKESPAPYYFVAIAFYCTAGLIVAIRRATKKSS